MKKATKKVTKTKVTKVTNAPVPTSIIVHETDKRLDILADIVSVNEAVVESNRAVVEALGNITLLSVDGKGKDVTIMDCTFISK